MKKIGLIALAATVAGCTGVTTGVKSKCFGNTEVDGTYVTRSSTNHFSFASGANIPANGDNGCGLEDL